ncbi:hypothetical protein CMK18_08355 [Candidatus Poribacteria bacterium]|nr:hypothetical protein [Candidatus Poribacteria bacterium]
MTLANLATPPPFDVCSDTNRVMYFLFRDLILILPKRFKLSNLSIRQGSLSDVSTGLIITEDIFYFQD